MASGISGRSVAADSKPSGDIHQVFAIFRHGIRTPHCLIPKFEDVYKTWPEGINNLTKLGKKQMYNLGKFIRQRYDGFLTGSPREVCARSLPNDRCYESMACLLAGAYPPQGNWVWSEDIKWQPIQIKTDLRDIVDILKKIVREKDSRNILEKNDMKELSDCFTKESGLDVKHILNLGACVDYVAVLKGNCRPVPEWAEDRCSEIMKAEAAFMSFLVDGIERQLAEPLLNALTNGLKSGVLSDKSSPRIHTLCCSDVMLLSLLRLFEPSAQGKPPFGACLFLEVLRKGEELSVEMYYLPGLDSEMRSIEVPERSPCSVQEFISFIQSDDTHGN